MLICPECGKQLSNKHAIAGHLWLAHQKRAGWKWELEKKVEQLTAELQQANNKVCRMDMETMTLQKDNTKLKRWTSGDNICLNCGHDMGMMHRKEIITTNGKNIGTVFLCGY
jgi:hypothetical protein